MLVGQHRLCLHMSECVELLSSSMILTLFCAIEDYSQNYTTVRNATSQTTFSACCVCICFPHFSLALVARFTKGRPNQRGGRTQQIAISRSQPVQSLSPPFHFWSIAFVPTLLVMVVVLPNVCVCDDLSGLLANSIIISLGSLSLSSFPFWVYKKRNAKIQLP